MTSAELRTLCFFEVLGIAPTSAELFLTQDVLPGDDTVREDAVAQVPISSLRGRMARTEVSEQLVSEIESRDFFQSRKHRRAACLARFFSWIPGIRFVALANTTAFGNARDGGDLDFLMITRAHMLWTVRLFAVLPLRVLRLTPRGGNERDAACLSYFIADSALNLSSHQIDADDPYFRYWFLSLVPLVDDGIGEQFWNSNAWIRTRHVQAKKFETAPELFRRPHGPRVSCTWLEPVARWIQQKKFPSVIREEMNRGTSVIVNDEVLKFHVEDGRIAYRERYRALCRVCGISS